MLFGHPIVSFWRQIKQKLICLFFLTKILEFTRSPILRLHKNLKQQHSSSEDLKKRSEPFPIAVPKTEISGRSLWNRPAAPRPANTHGRNTNIIWGGKNKLLWRC